MNKAKFLSGILGVFLLSAAQASAQPTTDEIARRRAEQALPRVAVAFDPPMFDKYVGHYQLGPKAIFTISRDGGHFLARLTRQKEIEIFPENASKFFATVIPAQISFNSDAQGQVTGLVLHQGGREVVAPRIDEGVARNIGGVDGVESAQLRGRNFREHPPDVAGRDLSSARPLCRTRRKAQRRLARR